MTNQEMFDRVVAHARNQGCKATMIIELPSGEFKVSCRYRTPEGLKCFIGALIPDANYSVLFENELASMPNVRAAAGILPEQKHLAGDLQQVHDNAEITRWEDEFKRLAKNYNLTYTPPTA